ncbi:hypothetical protein WJ40_12550 [Burkholderia cepacia]|nr:hypothetical protein WJ40_12550 [Burkholderia cepacia]
MDTVGLAIDVAGLADGVLAIHLVTTLPVGLRHSAQVLVDRIEHNLDTLADFGPVPEDDNTVAGPAGVVVQRVGVAFFAGGRGLRFRGAGARVHDFAIGDSAHRLRIRVPTGRYQMHATVPTELVTDGEGAFAALFPKAECLVVLVIVGPRFGHAQERKADEHRWVPGGSSESGKSIGSVG